MTAINPGVTLPDLAKSGQASVGMTLKPATITGRFPAGIISPVYEKSARGVGASYALVQLLHRMRPASKPRGTRSPCRTLRARRATGPKRKDLPLVRFHQEF
jgi:hypothetical protein